MEPFVKDDVEYPNKCGFSLLYLPPTRACQCHATMEKGLSAAFVLESHFERRYEENLMIHAVRMVMP